MNENLKQAMDDCPSCGYPLSAQLRHCSYCQQDVGFPNVRLASKPQYTDYLLQRYSELCTRIIVTPDGVALDVILAKIEAASGVVICTTPSACLSLMDNNLAFVNYHAMVEVGMREPAVEKFDKTRHGVDGILFGGYASEIIFGVLSMNQLGLDTYGDFHLRIENLAVKHRTSFISCNSYKLVNSQQLKPGMSIPEGELADWDHRGYLAILKHQDELSSNNAIEDVLIRSDHIDRSNDDFIEAHIFGTISAAAVQSAVLSNSVSSDRLNKAILKKIQKMIDKRQQRVSN